MRLPSRTNKSPKPWESTSEVNKFMEIPHEQQLLKLQQMHASKREKWMQALPAHAKDALLGESPQKVNIPRKGRVWDVDWSTFSPKRKEYSFIKAHALAVAAKHVYEDLSEVVKAYEKEGFSVKTYDRGHTQAFLAFRDDVAILSFRGTESGNLNDYLTDLDLLPTKVDARDPTYGRVHRGFQEALADVWGDLRQDLQELNTKDIPLFVTGHSLGGALALLASAALKRICNIDVQGVYVFGAPRIGDPTFVECYNQTLGERTFRHRIQDDIVTHLPPRELLSYQHIGHEIHFDENGQANLNQDDVEWEIQKKQKFLSPRQRFLLWRQRNRSKESITDFVGPVWNHGPGGYVRNLFLHRNENLPTRTSAPFKK